MVLKPGGTQDKGDCEGEPVMAGCQSMSSIVYLTLTVRDILLHTEPSLESISAGPRGIGGGDLDLQTRTRLTLFDGPRRVKAFYFQIYISEHLQNSIAYTFNSALHLPWPAPLP